MTRRAIQRVLCAGYALFIVYGSLVPFDFTPLSLAQAWSRMLGMQMYALGAQSRADWIANGVLYVPLGFLCAQLLGYDAAPARRRARALRLALAFAGCAALAVGVECVQVFFAPRTVSLNDVVAELIGSLVGLILATYASRGFAALFGADPALLRRRLLEAYLAGYLALSLFPYDFVLSAAEFADKLASDDWGWLLAGNRANALLSALKALIEVVLTLPFGVFLAARSAPRRATYGAAALGGIALGGLIELAQLCMVSGIAQGLSVFTRAAGVCGGLALWRQRDALGPERLRRLIARHVLALGALYLVALLLASGVATRHWTGAEQALARLGEISFLPLYYHYYTSEARALVSVATTCLLYLPIGVLIWASRANAGAAFVLALLAAGVVETGKLFIADLRPDPTNVLLAALAAYGGALLARRLESTARPLKRHAARPEPATRQAEPVARRCGEVADGSLTDSVGDSSTASTTTAADAPAADPVSDAPATPARATAAGSLSAGFRANVVRVFLGLPLIALAAYAAATFPLLAPALCAVLMAAGALVWYRPASALVIIAAALPVFDLAPWSGRFFLDEYDLLLAVCLAVAFLRLPAAPQRGERRLSWFAAASVAVGTSLVISSVRGMLPWPTLDANAFNNYLSAFNALRIAKGALWALLIALLLRRLVAARIDVRGALAWGMVGGLSLSVAAVFWERVAFSGIANFVSDYRVTGPFSAMHIGGAYIECFLTIAVPFLVVLIVRRRNWALRLLGTLLLLATTYALMVTFSRNGYLAFAVALAIVLLLALRHGTTGWRNGLLAVLVGAALLAVALPVFTGQFAQSRLASVTSDFATRRAHWIDALEMRTPDLPTTLFGMGIGSYPRSHYLTSREGGRAGSYRLGEDDGRPYLRLVSGSSIYVEQLLALDPRQSYLLRIEFRANKPKASVTVPICEKWLLTSYNCSWTTASVGPDSGLWQHYETRIGAGIWHDAPWYARRPIKLALYNGEADTAIDVRQVRLENAEGKDLLRNGDFAHGLDHWFFSADSHLAWHAKSLPVALLFDQGVLGVIAVGLFALFAAGTAARRAWSGDLDAAAALAAFVGFLVVGAFDTLIDAPRFLLLLLLLGTLCGDRWQSRPLER